MSFTTDLLASSRGLVLHWNKRGEILPLEDLKKWIRVCCDIFKSDKIDFLTETDTDFSTILNLSYFCKEIIQVPLSIHTTFLNPPKNLYELKNHQILDINLICLQHNYDQIVQWINACKEIQLPIRLTFVHSLTPNITTKPKDFFSILKQVSAISFAHHYPFIKDLKENHRPKTAIEFLEDLYTSAQEHQVPFSIIGPPFCMFQPNFHPYIVNSQQYYANPQFYRQQVFDLANKLWKLPSYKIRKVLEIKLKEGTSFHWGIDNITLPWILNHPMLYIYVWVWHKLTRHWKSDKKPKPLPENVTELEFLVQKLQAEKEKKWGNKCVACGLRYICDQGKNPFFSQKFEPKPIQMETIRNPMHFQQHASIYLDQLDAIRLKSRESLKLLYDDAIRIISHEKPWLLVEPEQYEIENHHTHHMPGAVRWFSFDRRELTSTPLCKTEPPLTISVTFGGGFAELIGFSFGKHIKILCPMVAQSHKVTLHINKNGDYILLRDNELISPIQFENAVLVPKRLPSKLEPKISIWNIDGEIVTQGVTLWKPQGKATLKKDAKKFSVLYVCSKFANRLRASLLSIAHQKDFNLKSLEIIVAYVPELDATEDVLECFESSFPHIRIVRSPFHPSHWKSKGYLINSSLTQCDGDWIILVDADILFPPHFFAILEKYTPTSKFIAPEGRKMLSLETTAKILMDEIKPWDQYETLLNAEGEIRIKEALGIPIGFCQCCNKEIFEKIKYPELEHFEGADWYFGKSVIDTFGQETRLKDVILLHLHHSGSQWYGTQKHR